MQIGTVAEKTGVSAKAIRYYESIGLIAAAHRTHSGYRVYGDRDVQTLRFIQRARGLGFSVGEVADMWALWRVSERHSVFWPGSVPRHLDFLTCAFGDC